MEAPDPAKADHFKEIGNMELKRGNWPEAFLMYDIASYHNPCNPLFYCNRALVGLNLADELEASDIKISVNGIPPEECLRTMLSGVENDCSKALALDGTLVKALFRRGRARRKLNKLQEAAADFEAALKLEPNNPQAQKELQAIQIKLWAGAGPVKRAFTEFRSEPVEAIQRTDWVGTLKRLKIEEFNSGGRPTRNAGQPVEQMEIEIDVKIPSPAKTSFQFYADWSHLRRCPRKRAVYLKSVGAENIPKLFKESLEADVFSDIIEICQQWSSKETFKDICASLTAVGRFDTLRMFLEDKEKQKIREILADRPDALAMWKQ